MCIRDRPGDGDDPGTRGNGARGAGFGGPGRPPADRGDHPLHDSHRATRSHRPQREPAAQNCDRLRHLDRRGQSTRQAVRRDAEAHEAAPRGPSAPRVVRPLRPRETAMAEFTPAPVETGMGQQDSTPTGPTRPARPAGLLRWGVALVVVALVVGAVSVGTIMLTSGSTTSTVEGWIPAGTVIYLEGRADLPGDQRQNVGTIIAKFPGFKDQASLDAKIDQALDQLLQKSGISWTTDLKPWVAGEVGVAVTRDLLDLAASAQKDPSDVKVPDRGAVVLASVKDAAAATAWVAKQAGGTPTTTTYGDGQITTVDKGGVSLAWATRGTVSYTHLRAHETVLDLVC